MLNHAVKFAFGLWAFIFSVHIVHIQKGLVGYHLMHKKKKFVRKKRVNIGRSRCTLKTSLLSKPL